MRRDLLCNGCFAFPASFQGCFLTKAVQALCQQLSIQMPITFGICIGCEEKVIAA
jgi:hypothetical protein